MMGYTLTVDLAAQQVNTPKGMAYHFDIDPFRKDCLYRGLDAIGLTLQHAAQIGEYEQRRRTQAPWLFQRREVNRQKRRSMTWWEPFCFL